MIPDKAVEAAARAAAKDEDASNWDDEPQYYRNGWLNRMQVALEAAAPHMLSHEREQARLAHLGCCTGNRCGGYRLERLCPSATLSGATHTGSVGLGMTGT